ncbi:MAG: DNA mismatch repair endonuclease MutL [Clostridia bacterium]|nr:DNA mismatch repair endonuclease MutL [Clostridia bacterium]
MIKVLPKNVSELIAAGEVVERPVSVVKELVENSIDAGAPDITVEIKDGGITYIRVSDNGCGIPRDEVPTAFLRHATSKLQNADQLNSIETMGFRGEALAAICAVSRTDMITKCASDEVGTAVRYVAGDLDSCEDAGCPTGTTVVVRDLFFSTPARMKFLKKDASEAAAVASFMDRVALANTGIAFKFIKNGAEEMRTPGDGRLDAAINAVFGRKFAETLAPVEGNSWGIGVSGFTSQPAFPRANRSMQIFFVNGRLVRSKTFTAALDASYANLVPSGKFAACVLNLTLNPALVDINVHPAKLEVRFTDDHAVFDAIYHAVKSALQGKKDDIGVSPSKVVEIGELKSDVVSAAPVKSIFAAPAAHTPAEQTRIPETEARISVPRVASFQSGKQEERAVSVAAPSSSPSPAANTAPREPEAPFFEPSAVKEEKTPVVRQDTTKTDVVHGYNYVGEVYRTYLVFESESGVLFVDKHAAHERIIFNRLKKSFNPDSDAQLLLSPVTVSLDKTEARTILDNVETLAQLGFDVEDFGAGQVTVRSVPVKLNDDDVSSLLQLMAEKLPKGGKRSVSEAFYDDVLHSVACKAAVKAGRRSSEEDAEDILRMLDEDPDARFCPHGRPVCFEIKRGDLDKQFLR